MFQKPCYYAGIDPGLSGAIALYKPTTGGLIVIDMPCVTAKVNKKDRRSVDLQALAQWMDENGPLIKHACIELVHTMPGQGIASSGTFMRAFGNVEAMIASAFVPMVYASPQKWKRHFGLNSDKSLSRQRASEIFPEFQHLWKRKKDDGRAEAALLAMYGYERAEGKRAAFEDALPRTWALHDPEFNDSLGDISLLDDAPPSGDAIPNWP